MVLLVASGFYWLQFRIAERLDAARRADAALENAYEELRAGAIPLVSGSLGTTDDGVALEAVVTPSESAPLTDVTLVARYRLRGEARTRELEARLFVP